MTKAAELAQVASTGVSPGFKNRIINGDMRIDQRNAGASVTPTNTQYTLDRWAGFQTTASKFTVQQNAGSVTPPAGFRNYLGCTSSSAYSIGSADVFGIYQWIEGFNISDLMWGTANAKTITISFWVRSSLTGTFGGVLQNGSQNRCYPFTYTISSANTWEQKSVTIAGDTTGTWATSNTAGINLVFNLGTGSTFSGTAGAWAGTALYSATGATSVVGTNGATFYITGVQLEVGSTATSFDYRPYGTELALCQRYFQSLTYGTGSAAYAPYGLCRNALTLCVGVYLPVQMRSAPTATYTVNSGTNVLKQDGATYAVTLIRSSASTVNEMAMEVEIGSSSLNTTGCAGFYGGSFVVNATAEL